MAVAMNWFGRRARREATNPIEPSPGVRLLRDRAEVERAVSQAMRLENATAQRAAERIARYQKMATPRGSVLNQHKPVANTGR
jgi:hypothetical protein